MDNQSIIELTRAAELLASSITRMTFFMAISMFVLIGFTWFIIKYYEKLSNHSLGSFNSEKAQKLFDTNRVQELLKYCLKYQRKYPNDVQINFHLGLTHYRLGNFF